MRLIRINNLLIIIFTQYVVRIFLIGPKQEWWKHITDVKFFLLSVSTVCVAAAGYIINDYYDVKIDTINKPGRVVVGRMLRRRKAMIAHSLLTVIGILIGFIVGWRIGVVNIFAAFFLWLYSNQLKRLPFIGNLTIALLTALSLLVVVMYIPKNLHLVSTFAVFAFFISLIREIIKDMEDVKGDATFGCQTLPIVWGIRRTKIILYVLVGAFLFTLLAFSAYLDNKIITYFCLFVLLPMGWFTYRLVKADTKKEFAYLSRFCKIIMLSGVISMVLV